VGGLLSVVGWGWYWILVSGYLMLDEGHSMELDQESSLFILDSRFRGNDGSLIIVRNFWDNALNAHFSFFCLEVVSSNQHPVSTAIPV
jgi:hypothetical protein